MFKMQLVDLARQYCSTLMKQSCRLTENHIKELQNLKNNECLIRFRPNEGLGVVILNRAEYTRKMNDIFGRLNEIFLGYQSR